MCYYSLWLKANQYPTLRSKLYNTQHSPTEQLYSVEQILWLKMECNLSFDDLLQRKQLP